MDTKTPGLWLWVYEPTPTYLNVGKDISRRSYLAATRRHNGDTKDEYSFQQIRSLRIAITQEDWTILSKLFPALGWKQGAPLSFHSKGTEVIFQIDKRTDFQAVEMQKLDFTEGSHTTELGGVSVEKFKHSLLLRRTDKQRH